MPNWCDNYLTIHADENLLNQIRDFVRSEESEFDFTKILPIPKEKENDSYEWRCENWGTKWNADCIYTYENGFSFETAWAPCSPIIAELARIFPEAEFWFQYTEENMCFCGVQQYQNGTLVYEMESDYTQNWTLLEDASVFDEDELKAYLIDDIHYPSHENGMYIYAETEGEFHLREYINGEIYILMDGWCRDLRPENERTAFWNEETNFQWL